MSKRIEYIDVAKAIGILLVILGHCYYTATVPYLGAAIYSFHMPMFFIISGMFLKPMGVREGFAKYSKAYVKPYIITGLLMLLVTLLLFALKIVDSNEFILDFERIAFGSGSNEDKALLHDIPTVGPIWFLLALFWGCLLTSVIKKNVQFSLGFLMWTFAIFFIGYISSKYIRLPLSFQMGLCSVPFILTGSWIRQFDVVERFGELNRILIVLLAIIWLTSVFIMGNSLNMASCRYREGIVCVPLSIIATLLCLSICKKYDFRILRWMKWLGRNTLYVLAGHQLLQFLLLSISFDNELLGTFLPPPITICLEFPLQVLIAVVFGLTIKKLKLF